MMPEFIVEDIDRIPNFCEDLYQHCRDDDRASISLGEADRATGSLKVWLRSARRLRRVEGMIRKLENNLLSVLSRLAATRFQFGAGGVRCRSAGARSELVSRRGYLATKLEPDRTKCHAVETDRDACDDRASISKPRRLDNQSVTS
jgi:hypothetical protein